MNTSLRLRDLDPTRLLVGLDAFQHNICLVASNKQQIFIIIIIFIYLPSDVISQEKKTATSSRSITKASKYAIPLKPNTQTCRVKAIFSHLVRRQRRTERSSKSTATSPS